VKFLPDRATTAEMPSLSISWFRRWVLAMIWRLLSVIGLSYYSYGLLLTLVSRDILQQQEFNGMTGIFKIEDGP
jgi:hypothetical protein